MISSQAFKESSLGLQMEGRGNLHSGPGTEEQRPTWGGRKAERAAVLGAGVRWEEGRSRGLWEVPPPLLPPPLAQRPLLLTSVFSRLQPMAGLSICVYP